MSIPRPTQQQILDFASYLRGKTHTDGIPNESMHRFHFGCSCHSLGDVTKFGIKVVGKGLQEEVEGE